MSFGSTLFRFPCSHPAWPQTTKKTRCFRIKPATLQTRDFFHVEVLFFDIAGDAVILVGDFNANSASLTIQVAMSSRGCMEYYLEVLLKPISTCSHPWFWSWYTSPFRGEGPQFFWKKSAVEFLGWFVYERFVDLKKKVLHFLIFLRIPFITEDHIHPAGFLVFQCTNDGRCDILRIESNTLGRIFVGLGTRMDDTMAASCKKNNTGKLQES